MVTVLDNLERLVAAKRRNGATKPVLDLQFLDWGYNRQQIPDMRQMARRFGANRLTVIRPEYAADAAKADPRYPKRCFWLWCVLTVGWDLDVHSCTNAWTYRFPGASLRTSSLRELWNSEPMVKARRFNRRKQSEKIAADTGCMCNRCTDMRVVDRPEVYVCE
jgi:MoaA/NifB/PqqE/SkfB family radical SAM enzyme